MAFLLGLATALFATVLLSGLLDVHWKLYVAFLIAVLVAALALALVNVVRWPRQRDRS